MEISHDELFEIEVLVFSSQKTATQTILSSLNESGVNCLHGHTPENVGLTETLFREYLGRYIEINNRPLKVISVFRDPLERMISSFFQSMSEDKFAYTHPNQEFPIHDPTENLLYRLAPAAVCELFYHYCDRIDGWGESIVTVCKVLDLEIEALHFSEINKLV